MSRLTSGSPVNDYPEPDNSVEIMSASYLLEQEYDPARWVIDDLIPIGFSVLVSPPKIGKSFFALQASFHVAHGTPAFWTYPTHQGEALNIDLELPPPDAQNRLRRYLLAHKVQVPTGLMMSFEWPTFDRGGLDRLVETIETRPGLRFIIIDVLAKLWPESVARGSGNSYRTEYAILTKLKNVADKYNVGILAVHHTNKIREFEDPLSTVSGTNAMTGVPDCVMVVHRQRGEQDSKLFITGRKVREREIDMRFDNLLCAWYVDNDPIVPRERNNGTDTEDTAGTEQRDGAHLPEGDVPVAETYQGNGSNDGPFHAESAAAVAQPVPEPQEGPSDQRGLWNSGSDGGGS